MTKTKVLDGTYKPYKKLTKLESPIKKPPHRKRKVAEYFGDPINTNTSKYKDDLDGLDKVCRVKNVAELNAYIAEYGIPKIHGTSNKMGVESHHDLLDLLYNRYSNVRDLGGYSGKELEDVELELPRHYVVRIPLLWCEPKGTLIEYNFEHGCQKDCEVKTGNSTMANGTYANMAAALDDLGADYRGAVNLGIEHVYNGKNTRPVQSAIDMLKRSGDVHFMGVIQIWERVRMCQSYDGDKGNGCVLGKAHILSCLKNTECFKKRYTGKNPLFWGALGAEKLRTKNKGGKNT